MDELREFARELDECGVDWLSDWSDDPELIMVLQLAHEMLARVAGEQFADRMNAKLILASFAPSLRH